MKVKVCGMKYPENIDQIIAAGPDYLGFIFYDKSKRFAGNTKIPQQVKGITKVGVFVNESAEKINTICKGNGIQFIQLHGDESPELCGELKEKGYSTIKVFSVGETFDFQKTKRYDKVADYFLFDTKSENYGGTGKKFDWEILKKYDNIKEIFLSGGIGPEDIETIKKIDYLKIHAVDINSCFEDEPGLKNVDLVTEFIRKIKQ